MCLGRVGNFQYILPRFTKSDPPVVHFRNFKREFRPFSLFRYLKSTWEQILGVGREDIAERVCGAQTVTRRAWLVVGCLIE